ncbi:MAG: sodium:calcium antiporter [Nitrospinae bacterium]|nr:sodium:calcium antiporter [Nitrospinota bacterium]
MTQYAMLVVSAVVVLAGASLFTNGLEWFGKRLGLSDHAVGSVFAAVGTAMPETMVPIIAIMFGTKAAGHAVGIGAIIGAPFMLATLAMFVTGVAVVWNRDNRPDYPNMNVDPRVIKLNLECFMGFYALAVAASFVDVFLFKLFVSCLLVLFYAIYAVYAVKSGGSSSGENDVLEPCWFAPKSENPPLPVIFAQITSALVLIIWGAELFVDAIQAISLALGASPLLLSMLIVPVATELPEKFNSVVWIKKGKDTLALGNITGSMVWQSTAIMTVGIMLTDWKLGPAEMWSVLLTMLATLLVYVQLRRTKRLTPAPLLAGGFFYLLFALIMVLRGAK